MTNTSRLVVGDGITTARSNWTFGGGVADTFVSHVSNSVPLYLEGHDLICKLTDYFVRSGSTCYELGVSTGELISKLARFNSQKDDVTWIGVDCEPEMVERAREHCSSLRNVQILRDDVSTVEFRPSDFIVSYYCIQFIPPKFRQEIFDRIYKSLNWGGAFVIFEKVRAPDARFQDMSTGIYHDWKAEQGFETSEIVAKSQSIRGVLEPFTSGANVDFLRRAGFVDVWSIAKYVCFEGFVAIK